MIFSLSLPLIGKVHLTGILLRYHSKYNMPLMLMLALTLLNQGQVLNFVSSWWFEKTKDIVPNHIIAHPHPNVVVCKSCLVFPIEFVVRGYITGSTSTSMWTNYAKGDTFMSLCYCLFTMSTCSAVICHAGHVGLCAVYGALL